MAYRYKKGTILAGFCTYTCPVWKDESVPKRQRELVTMIGEERYDIETGEWKVVSKTVLDKLIDYREKDRIEHRARGRAWEFLENKYKDGIAKAVMEFDKGALYKLWKHDKYYNISDVSGFRTPEQDILLWMGADGYNVFEENGIVGMRYLVAQADDSIDGYLDSYFREKAEFNKALWQQPLGCLLTLIGIMTLTMPIIKALAWIMEFLFGWMIP